MLGCPWVVSPSNGTKAALGVVFQAQQPAEELAEMKPSISVGFSGGVMLVNEHR